MKKQVKKIFLVLFLINPYLSIAQGIVFTKGTWEEIKHKAEKENKLIFIDVYTSWCGPCRKLAKEVFPLEEVGNYYNKNFVNYKMDAEKGEGIDIARNYAVGVFPTMLFIAPDGELLHRSSGYIEAEEMVKLGEIAFNPEKRFGVLEEAFSNGNRDKEYVLGYFEALKEAKGNVDPKLGIYLSELSKEELLTKENYDLILYYAHDVKGEVFKILLDNYDEFKQIGNEKEMIDKIESRFILTHSHHVGAGFAEQFVDKTIIPFLKTTNYIHKDRLAELMEISYLANNREVEGLIEKSNTFLNKYAKNDPDLILNVLNRVSRLANSEDEINMLISWSDMSLRENEENSEAYFINYTLKEKVKDYEGALLSAQKNLELKGNAPERKVFPLYSIAQLYVKMGKIDKAKETAEQALVLFNDFEDSTLQNTNLNRTKGLIEDLIKSLKS